MNEPKEKEYLTREISKIRGSIERLWRLTEKTELDRNECLNIIHRIDRSINSIISIFKSIWVKKLSEIPPEKLLMLENVLKKFFGKGMEEIISEHLTSLKLVDSSFLSYQLENPKTFKDEETKKSIRDFCKRLEEKITILENLLDLKRGGIEKIAEFLGEFPFFTENWAVGVVYLSAMEIAVKEALKKRGKETKRNFKENVNELIACLKNEGIQIGSLEELLPSTFWTVRNKIIHEGYSPTYEELETIIRYVINFMKKIE